MEFQTSTNWYVAQLTGDALKPAKIYSVEVGKLGGRYLTHEEIGSTVIVNTSQRYGFELYIPFEKKMVIHHRTKAVIEKKKSLIPGYAFVRNIADFGALSDAKGVSGVLTSNGTMEPLRIPEIQINKIRTAEADIEKKYQQHLERQRFKNNRKKLLSQKLTRSSVRTVFPAGAKFRVNRGYLAGQTGVIKDGTGRKTIKAMVEMLGGLVPAELTIDQIELLEVAS